MSKYAPMQDTQRPFVKRVAGPLFLVLVMFYLAFHAVSGERGAFALFKENRKLTELQTELADIKTQRATLEHKVDLLSDSSLDLDLLDEQVHRVLGMADKSELVYFMDDDAAAKK
jgi:cell division protein FtsB